MRVSIGHMDTTAVNMDSDLPWVEREARHVEDCMNQKAVDAELTKEEAQQKAFAKSHYLYISLECGPLYVCDAGSCLRTVKEVHVTLAYASVDQTLTMSNIWLALTSTIEHWRSGRNLPLSRPIDYNLNWNRIVKQRFPIEMYDDDGLGPCWYAPGPNDAHADHEDTSEANRGKGFRETHQRLCEVADDTLVRDGNAGLIEPVSAIPEKILEKVDGNVGDALLYLKGRWIASCQRFAEAENRASHFTNSAWEWDLPIAVQLTPDRFGHVLQESELRTLLFYLKRRVETLGVLASDSSDSGWTPVLARPDMWHATLAWTPDERLPVQKVTDDETCRLLALAGRSLRPPISLDKSALYRNLF